MSITRWKLSDPLQPVTEAECETQVPLFPSIKKPFCIQRLITCCRLQLLSSSISSFWQFSLKAAVWTSDSSEHRVGGPRTAETLAVALKVKCVVEYLSSYRYQIWARGFKSCTVTSHLNACKCLRIQDKRVRKMELRLMSGTVILFLIIIIIIIILRATVGIHNMQGCYYCNNQSDG